MVFVGFMDGSKAVRYWDKRTGVIKVSRNISFNKNEELRGLEIVKVPSLQAEREIEMNSASKTTAENPTKILATVQILHQSDRIEEEQIEQIFSPKTQNLCPKTKINYKQLNDPQLRQLSTQIKQPSIPSTPPDVARPTESSKVKSTPQEQANLAMDTFWKVFLEDEDLAFRVNEDNLLKNYEEAIRGVERMKWKAAMDKEIGTLGKIGTWKLEDLPADRKPVGCQWVFLRKHDENGQTIKYKA